MSTRNRLVWLCFLLGSGLLFAACTGTTPPISTTDPHITPSPLTPQVVNHSKPSLALSNSDAFRDVGCPPDKYGFRQCEKGSPLAALGCDLIREPDNLLGGLNPHYPIVECIVIPYQHDEQEPGKALVQFRDAKQYIYESGCVVPVYIRYIVFRADQFQIIKTKEEFQAVFAPIDSENEALSYALAVTNLSAHYGLEAKPSYRYFADKLEDTHVVQTKDGYEVYLYDYGGCSCSPLTISSVTVSVTTAGEVAQIGQQPIYMDTQEPQGCP